MSYHEIEVVHRWSYVCRNCGAGFMGEADSAGQAEELAKHHINEDVGDENPRPHGNCVVTISPMTLVGRQL